MRTSRSAAPGRPTAGSRDQDIAIVGMACVFPGAGDVKAYWENILAGVDAVGDPPPEWGADAALDPTSTANDRLYCARGGYLGRLAEFDPTRYGIMPNSVDGGEPDHFLALKVAFDALADAGCLDRSVARDRAEVIIGRGTYVNRGNTTVLQHTVIVDQVLRILAQLHPEHDASELEAIKRELKASLPPFHAETAAALVPNIISGRIANRLDLMGANYIVDAACASSIVAIDLGVRDLLAGRCDLALVGGVHASTPPPIVTIFCQLNAISRKGRIRPFDAEADGTLLGEGAGMIVLRRLADAERDGDRIYAVLKGVGVASDGRALGLLAPRVEGEELALRRAYDAAGVAPDTVGLIEAHGTATPVGDATEIEALKRVFGERREGEAPRCAIGSVKSMISHLMPASGIAGLIKVALALHHKVLPPTLHVERPNPKLGLERTVFYLNTRTRPWIHGSPDAPRRAGVNAFGFGGINAHVVVEEYGGSPDHAAPNLQHRWDSEVFVLSGDSRDEVIALAGRVRAWLAREPEAALKDLAYTLNVAGTPGSVRLAVVAGTAAELDERLARAVTRLGDPRTTRIRDIEGIYYFASPLGAQGRVAFVFPGEGAQYEDMLADLCVHFPVVRAEFDSLDRIFLRAGRGYVPSEAIFPPPQPGRERGDAERERLYRMDLGAEAVFVANQALVALMRQLGVRPDAMVGHSTGEHSALLAAGVVDVRDEAELAEHVLGVNAVYEDLETRGDIPGGLLVATGGVAREPLDALVAATGGTVHVALDNCPHQIVLCGQPDGIETVVRELQARHAICQRLPFARAYHTPWFEVFCAPLRRHLDRVRIKAGDATLYSCVTAERFPEEADAVRDLVSVQWARTVRFRETIEAMYRDGVRVFVEVGPRGNLTAFIDDILRGKAYAALAANVPHRSGITQLNHLVGQLVAHHVPVRLEALYERRAPERLDLDAAPAAKAGAATRRVTLATGLQPLSLSQTFAIAARRPRDGTPAVPLPPVPLTAGRAGLLDRHVETMSQFLAVQQQVMTAYLGRRSPGSAMTAGRAAAASPGPLIDEVVALEPGRRVVALHRLDPARDRFLDDHTLGRDISDEDPSLGALAVVPLTVTMELVAEAAALLRPDGVLVGLREFRAHRWITVEAPLTLELVAEAAGADEVRVVLREPRADASAGGPVLAEAMAQFADARPASPGAGPFGLVGERASGWATEALYRDGMFHGPAFRAVASMDSFGEDGASATLEVLPRSGLLAGRPDPRFLLDPVLLDAAGQVLAFWVKEKLGVGVDVFPYRVGAVRAFAPPPPPGTRVTCRVRGAIDGLARTTCDIDLVDASGRVLWRLESWEDRQFRLPPGLLHLRIAPREAFIGAAWRPPLASASAESLEGSRVTGIDPAALEAHQGIWLKMLAALVLGRRERAIWRELASATGKRRIEWLLGRVAVKEAVRRLVKRCADARLLSADIEVLPDGLGRPVVWGRWQERLAIAPAVSISHSDGVVVAIAARDGRALVGVDVERLSVDTDAIAAAAFSGEERRWLGTLDEDHQREWCVRLWCAKEAATKALGQGFSRGLGALQLKRAELGTGAVCLEARDDGSGHANGRRALELVTHTARDGDYVASAILQPAEGRVE